MKPEGLMTPEACTVLFELAADVEARRAIVEIGSFKGQSTCYLGWGANERLDGGAHVWAVDPWDLPGNPYGKHGYSRAEVRETFNRQISAAGLSGRVTPVQGFSVDVARSWHAIVGIEAPAIGLLYVDGDHERASVLADFREWRKHLAPRAVIAFDDWGTKRNPGVAGAVKKLRLSGALRVLDIRAERIAVCELLS